MFQVLWLHAALLHLLQTTTCATQLYLLTENELFDFTYTILVIRCIDLKVANAIISIT